jgi:hypothetical protein
MNCSRRGAWILSVGLLVLWSCKDDDAPVADPLDDPWVDAIETGDEQRAAVAGLEAEPSAEPSVGLDDAPLALAAEAGSRSEAPPPTAVIATPAEGEAKPSSSPAPADSDPAKAPAAAPEQPATEPPAEPEPAPASSPSAEPAKPASPAPVTSADFHGSYRYIGGSGQRDDVKAAVETTVTALPRVIQGIARKRLTATNPVDSSVDIVVAGDTVTTTFETGFNASCVIDGGTVNATDIEGGKLKVRLRAKGSKLVQQMEGKGGARTIVYVLSADRKTLTVHHKITSDRLPEPLIYRLSYSRK